MTAKAQSFEERKAKESEVPICPESKQMTIGGLTWISYIMQTSLTVSVFNFNPTVQIRSSVSGPPFYLPLLHFSSDLYLLSLALVSSSLSPSRALERVAIVAVIVVVAAERKRERRGTKKMLLGKRPRPPMKRTTSMSEITFDLNTEAQPQPSDPHDQQLMMKMAASSSPSPRNHRRNSADLVETPHFLRACGLCKRRLVPGRDIYMYR